jgi:peptidyl-prolyl cis-trans isomerase C
MLLFLLNLACQPAVEERVPGELARTGETLETVNGQPVTRGMLDAMLSAMPAEVRTQIEEQGQIGQLQEQLVTQELLYQEALKLELHKQPDVQTILTFAEREALVEAMLRKIAEEKTTDEAMQAWYASHKVQFRRDEVKLRQIVVDTEADAVAVVEAAKAGTDFATLAKDKSVDPSTAEKGGEVGWVPRAQMPPDLKAALDTADKGAIVGPIAAMGKQIVLQVEDAREVVPFEEVKDQIKPQVQQELVREWVTELQEANANQGASVEAPLPGAVAAPAEGAE